MRLMIVESPNKTKKIASYLGPGWRIEASFGHIRDMPTKQIGVSAPDYQAQYEVPEKARSHVAKLRAQAREADEVFLATDPDREGEAISWHLQQELKLRNPKRVTFNSITEDAVKLAVSTPRAIDMDLVRAQEARRVLDRLVGYEVSPVVSDSLKMKASAGRVQSPAVRLVVEREEQIEKFKETKHFGAKVSFGPKPEWSAEWDTKPFLKGEDQYIMDKALAERAASCRTFRVLSSETKPVQQQPPAPFTTSTLLQAASASLSFNPAKTQEIAQKLFEGGHITYHRTDSQNLSDEAIAEVRAEAVKRGWPLPASPRRWISKDGAQEAHEAIRPTHWDVMDAGDTDDQRKLYKLIWLRAVACQLAVAEYLATTNLLEAQSGSETFRFKATGRIPKALGWRQLTTRDATDEDDESEESPVPALEKGSTIQALAGETLSKATKPPTRYTEASLVKALEAEGIGRPATFASIMTLIKTKNYVAVKGKALAPTPDGRAIVGFLRGAFSFINLDYTRQAEEALDDIAAGKAQYKDVVSRLHQQIREEMRGMGINPDAPRPPTEKMLGLATMMAKGLNIELPEATQASMQATRAWIDQHMETYQANREEARNTAMASDPATAKQIEMITKGISEGKASAPEGWPEISKLVASQLIEKILAAPSTAYASERQIDALRGPVGDNRVKAPNGWPDKVLARDASAALDQLYGGNKKGGSKKPAASSRSGAGRTTRPRTGGTRK